VAQVLLNYFLQARNSTYIAFYLSYRSPISNDRAFFWRSGSWRILPASQIALRQMDRNRLPGVFVPRESSVSSSKNLVYRDNLAAFVLLAPNDLLRRNFHDGAI